MGRAVGLVEPVRQLPQHGRIAVDRADIEPELVGQRRQPVEGAKDIAGAVDEVEVLGGHEWDVAHRIVETTGFRTFPRRQPRLNWASLAKSR